MGVDEVHRVLLDIFPQVDSRVLRAVAFAHSNDAADSAVESVLIEVIPFLSEDISKSLSGSPSEALGATATTTDLPNATFLLEPVHDSLKYTEKGESSKFPSSHSVLSGESEDEEATSLRKGKSKARSDESLLSQSLGHRKVGASAKLSDREDSDDSLPLLKGATREDDSASKTSPRERKAKSRRDELPLLKFLENREVGSCAILPDLVGKNKSFLSGGAMHEKQLCEIFSPLGANSTVQECMENSQESNSQLGAGPETRVTVPEEQEASTIIASSKQDSVNYEMVDVHDESTKNTMVSSDYVWSIDLLEDLIGEAKNNKKTLISAMDSVISFAREVDLQEKAAEEARMKASRGCVDAHNKVQELKLVLKRAKEANDMHAGEVYAEKAVLTTEAKELQSRLLSLSDERDKSLKILDEMRESLEVRLKAAQKQIEEALQEKLEREASVREELALQERIMDEVVKESNLLKQEAEENSKLQDFLMDRGRIVDMLQGEISVKCQDVKLLKEKFDSRIPLSTSLFSTLGSSSRSSSRSMSPPLHVPRLSGSFNNLQKNEEFVDSFDTLQSNTVLDSYQTLERVPLVADSSSVTISNAEHLSVGEAKAVDESKVLVDEEWDLL